MIKTILRKPYRILLTKLTARAIKKHNPKIVTVMGDGQTSIGREIIYTLLKQRFPVRRNLESPEAEFSVPLTVLGYLKYPKNFLEWLWITIKTCFSLVLNPQYNHVLILELNFLDPEILLHWLKILKPEATLITGSVPIDYSELGIKKVVKITTSHANDILKPFEIAAMQIGRFYRLTPGEIEKALSNFTLPSSKIRYFPGINDSIIIDATHLQYPIKLESVLELAQQESSRKENVIFTDLKADKAALKNTAWKINPKNYRPKEDDIIIFRGNRDELLQKHEYLFQSSTPLV